MWPGFENASNLGLLPSGITRSCWISGHTVISISALEKNSVVVGDGLMDWKCGTELNETALSILFLNVEDDACILHLCLFHVSAIFITVHPLFKIQCTLNTHSV